MRNNSELRELKQNVKNAQHNVAKAIAESQKEKQKLADYYRGRLDKLEEMNIVEKDTKGNYCIKNTDFEFGIYDGNIYVNCPTVRPYGTYSVASSPRTLYSYLKKKNDPKTQVLETVCQVLYS